MLTKKEKGSRYIKVFNLTGECEVNLETTLKSWGRRFFISQWKDEYTLVQEGLVQGEFVPKLKARIRNCDALELIKKLNLVNVKSTAFSSGSTWYDSKTIKYKLETLKRKFVSTRYSTLFEEQMVHAIILSYEDALDSIPKKVIKESTATLEKNNEALSKLKEGDHIAFQWNYGNFGKEIVVASITIAKDTQVLVHWIDGFKSEGEWIQKNGIIAIGDNSAKSKIKGYSGKFNILLPDHELLNK